MFEITGFKAIPEEVFKEQTKLNTKTMEINPEFNLRVALGQVIAGALFSEMSMEDIVEIVKDVADDYLKEWKENND